MNETYVTVVGRVAGDLRQRRTKDGLKVVSFRMISNERRYDRDNEQWVDGKSLSLNVTCWRRLADGVFTSLGKGDPVIATGRLSLREYEFEGQRRTSVELDANAVGPDLSWCTADVQRQRPLAAVGDSESVPGLGQGLPAQGAEGAASETAA